MGYNKDLPREEQLKSVLKNYDKKQAECEALKAKCSKLQTEKELLEKQLAQSKTVYKNMLARFEGQQQAKEKANSVDWEEKYNQIKKKYDKKNKMYYILEQRCSAMKRSFSNAICSITNAYNGVTATKAKLDKDLAFISEDVDTTSVIDIPDERTQVPTSNDYDISPTSFKEWQEKAFVKYDCSILKNFLKTGSLRGISTMAKDFGVSALTKEQSFQYGLNTEHLTNDYITNVKETMKDIGKLNYRHKLKMVDELIAEFRENASLVSVKNQINAILKG